MVNNEAAIHQKLNYIKNSLMNDTYKEQSAIIQMLISETIQLIRETSFVYEIPYNNSNHTAHIRTYANRGRKAKASLIVDLEELQIELKKGNVKRCLAIIDGMLSSDLYTSDVKKKTQQWQPIGRSKVETRFITIK